MVVFSRLALIFMNKKLFLIPLLLICLASLVFAGCVPADGLCVFDDQCCSGDCDWFVCKPEPSWWNGLTGFFEALSLNNLLCLPSGGVGSLCALGLGLLVPVFGLILGGIFLVLVITYHFGFKVFATVPYALIVVFVVGAVLGYVFAWFLNAWWWLILIGIVLFGYFKARSGK